jgi:threonine aldolase
MAARLAEELQALGVAIAHPVEANAVFADLDHERRQALRAGGWAVYDFIGGATRFMCSWQTSGSDIDDVVACLAARGAGGAR